MLMEIEWKLASSAGVYRRCFNSINSSEKLNRPRSKKDDHSEKKKVGKKTQSTMVLMALMAYNALAHRTWCSLQQVEHVNHRWVSSQIVHVGFTYEVSLNVPKNFFIYDSAPCKDWWKSSTHICVKEKTIAAPSTNIFTGDWAINYDF